MEERHRERCVAKINFVQMLFYLSIILQVDVCRLLMLFSSTSTKFKYLWVFNRSWKLWIDCQLYITLLILLISSLIIGLICGYCKCGVGLQNLRMWFNTVLFVLILHLWKTMSIGYLLVSQTDGCWYYQMAMHKQKYSLREDKNKVQHL